MNPYYVFSGNDKKILKRGTINHPTVFVPKNIYEKIGLFDINFKNATDYEWLIRAKLQGITFSYIDQVISNMRLEGKSDKKWLNNYIEILRARNLHGMSCARNFLLFLEMTVITVCRKSLEYIGLHSIVRIYRKHFSITKKDTS
jgi:GT2 family glycosyltransferase